MREREVMGTVRGPIKVQRPMPPLPPIGDLLQQVEACRRPRPTWDATCMAIAETVAGRSTCLRASTGAVIVDPQHRIIATGYNGAPRGLDHCLDVGCEIVQGSCVRAIHAEQNALVQAARVGSDGMVGATIYSTHRPCVHCAKLIIQAGISSVFYVHDYSSDGALEFVLGLFSRAGVSTVKIATGDVQTRQDVVE